MIKELERIMPLDLDGVLLKTFTAKDLTDEYVSWLNDEEVVKYSNQRFFHHSISSVKEYFHSMQDNPNTHFLTITTQDNLYVGTVTLYANQFHKTVDIGIMIGNRDVWGKGLAKRAFLLLIDVLQERLGYRKVTAGTLECNVGMIKVLQSIGMVPDGKRVKQEIVDNQERDILYFARF